MDSISLLVSIVALLYVGMTIYAANQGDLIRLRWFLYGIIAGMIFLGLNLVLVASAGDMATASGAPLPEIEQSATLINLAFAILVATLSGALVTSPAARLVLQRVLPRGSGYDPESPVHLAAAVLSLAFIVVNTTQFVLSGGLGGLADAIETSGIALDQVAFVGLLWIVGAFLGVGLGMRRTLPQALARLGLRAPTREDVRNGILYGILLYVGSIVMATVWAALVSPDTFAEQTAASQQVGQAINSLPLVLVVSVSAALGEEIFFRGALQPVFGIVPVSLFFALIHTQYTLTPASVWILVVAVALGLVRQRTSTTAAIIAHFVYNFIPLALLLLIAAQGAP